MEDAFDLVRRTLRLVVAAIAVEIAEFHNYTQQPIATGSVMFQAASRHYPWSRLGIFYPTNYK